MKKVTGIYFKDNGWYIGFCLEIPTANGQGKTVSSCRKSLASCIALLLEEQAVDIMEYFPCDYFLEDIEIDERNLSGAFSYAKKLHSSPSREKAFALDKSGNRKKGSDASSQRNAGKSCKKNSKKFVLEK